MDWKELKHNINVGMTEFFKNRGNKPDIIFLGKREFDVLVNHFGTEDRWEEELGYTKDVIIDHNRLSMWNMDVHLDGSKESGVEFDRKYQSIFDLEDDDDSKTY